MKELLSSLVVVGHELDARGLGVFGLVAQEEQSSRREVEKRVEVRKEKREPVLHALRFASLAHRLVQGIVRSRTEPRDVTRTKTPDGILVERCFAGRQKFDFARLVGGELRLGIEAANGIKRRTEEVETKGLLASGRPDV